MYATMSSARAPDGNISSAETANRTYITIRRSILIPLPFCRSGGLSGCEVHVDQTLCCPDPASSPGVGRQPGDSQDEQGAASGLRHGAADIAGRVGGDDEEVVQGGVPAPLSV